MLFLAGGAGGADTVETGVPYPNEEEPHRCAVCGGRQDSFWWDGDAAVCICEGCLEAWLDGRFGRGGWRGPDGRGGPCEARMPDGTWEELDLSYTTVL